MLAKSYCARGVTVEASPLSPARSSSRDLFPAMFRTNSKRLHARTAERVPQPAGPRANSTLVVLLTASLSLVSIFAGCAHLQKDLVALNLETCPPQTSEQLAAQAKGFSSVSDDATLECALGFLRRTDDPALVRSSLGARICLLLAERATDQSSREKLAAEGVRMAEAALKAGAEQDGKVHYYLGVNLGVAVREHMTLAYEQLERLERELKRSFELSPDEDSGGPARVLAMLYLKAPAWPKGIGDSDKALEMLAEVVKKHPEHPLNHLFYAMALWEVDDEANLDQARLQLAEGKKLLDIGNWGRSREPWLKELLELEKELNKS